MRRQTITRLCISALALGGLLVPVSSAAANVYSTVNAPPLNESPQRIGTYTQSSNWNGTNSWAWIDDPAHTTVMGYYIAGGGVPPNSYTTSFSAHNTNRAGLGVHQYENLGRFDLWGRVAIGAGSMSGRRGSVGR